MEHGIVISAQHYAKKEALCLSTSVMKRGRERCMIAMIEIEFPSWKGIKEGEERSSFIKIGAEGKNKNNKKKLSPFPSSFGL